MQGTRKILLILMLAVAAVASGQDITGQIVDAETGDSIPFASLKYRGHNVSMVSNHAGRFNIERHDGWSLTFSAVGYKSKRVSVAELAKGSVRIALQPDSRQLDEVTVKSKRKKYRRRDNPAVELMRRVIAAKRRTDMSNHPFYEYQNYQKITLAINDIKPDDLEKGFFKRSKWMTAQVEPCSLNNKMILPLSVDETVTRKVYRKNPRSEKDIVLGQRSEGVNHVFQTGDMLNEVLKDAFTDVDIYDDQIRLLRHPFTSPIGKDAIAFYRYYIVDTVYVNKDKCYHLEFLPNNQQDFGFKGELYVLEDTTLHVRKCNLQLPKSSDVNFVDNLWVRQEYEQLDNGEWVLTVDDMVVEMSLLDVLTKGLVIRTTRKTDYSFGPLPRKLFKGKAEVVMDPDAKIRNDDFWAEHRKAELTRSEYSMRNFIHNMQQAKGYKWLLAGFKLLIENYIETGTAKAPSKVDIGPIYAFLSDNYIDGMRTRGSMQTTSNLSPHLFFKGYYAHGWKSDKDYYSAMLVYALNKKNYLFHEFPRRNLTFESTYDVYSPSDKFKTIDKDNIYTSFKWTEVDKMMFYNRQTMKFEYETDYNLSATATLKAEGNEACGGLRFVKLNEEYVPQAVSPEHIHNGKLRTADLTLGLRYAHGEKYMNTKQRRYTVNDDASVFSLYHSFGFKGFLGGEYSYNLTEASIYKRFWLKSWGKLEVTLHGGMQWNQVPYPLLIIPAANLSYVAEEDMFSMMNDMEFLNDRYASLNLAWDMKGKVFNRIPLLRRLKWREFIGFKMLWGDLSDKNNPMLERNAGNARLMYFPANTFVMDPDKPYMEAAFGIHNIFKILHIQYVYRINYHELPTARKHGVRFLFNFTF